jgi:nucleotide-binding universal stress UspA family protein
MKTSHTKRKIAETVVGAAVGAAIAGPVGAVAGGLVGSQASAHTPPEEERKHATDRTAPEVADPLIHAQLKRILVPIDFSASSRAALRFARDWAGRFGSEICLLHVVEPVAPTGVFAGEPLPPLVPSIDFTTQARAELETVLNAEFPNATNVSLHLSEGVPSERIAAAAEELHADLIVIATHGRTGLSHVLLGSTAERVVRHAPCPVLTLRRAALD